MTYGKILGTGKYLPEKVVTNFDLEKIVETSDEWIYSRTGIKERRIAVTETLVDLAVKAAQDAISSSGIDPLTIDLIIVATTSSEYQFPAVACLVQKAIGAKEAMAFDITAACSGFVFALQTANQYLQTETFKTALIIGAEKLSQITNWEDRNTCVLFGDGAGAAILVASDEPGVLASDCKSIGDDYKCLTMSIKRKASPFYEQPENVEDYIYMEGREVFEFACTKVPVSIEGVLEKAQITKDEVDYYILHQANARIIKTVAKKLGQPLEKFYHNMEFYGNTSAATIPVAMDELLKAGALAGKKAVISGFGGGLTYGSALIQF